MIKVPYNQFQSNNIVIFDVDRTLINTTSWYRACITPELLLIQEKIDVFKEMNANCFEKKKLDFSCFRKETLKLIENRDLFLIKKMKNDNEEQNKICLNNKKKRIYFAGVYTAYYLVQVYKEAIDLIRFFMKYYDGEISFLFLSSGYQEFIEGVIWGILNQYDLQSIPHKVVGSTLIELNDGIQEDEFLSQSVKVVLVKKLVEKGFKIRFLADDNDEDKELFSVVNKNGGYALLIKHIEGKGKTESWNYLWTKITFEMLKEYLSNWELPCKNPKEFYDMKMFSYIKERTDQIGIFSLPRDEYDTGIYDMSMRLAKNKYRNEFKQYMDQLVYQYQDIVYFRGKKYYCWLPDYVFADNKFSCNAWMTTFKTIIDVLKIIIESNIIIQWSVFSYTEKALVYMLIDHLFECLLSYLNYFERTYFDPKENEDLFGISVELREVLQNTSDLLVRVMLDFPISTEAMITLWNKLIVLKDKPITKEIECIQKMREIDNNVSIVLSALDIINNIDQTGKVFDVVISFPYGGISLGYILNSVCKLVHPNIELPKLICCYYSSKISKRTMSNSDVFEEFSIFHYIPKYYDDIKEGLRKGEYRVLLYDNNVTTFETVNMCKINLRSFGNTVCAAVVSINYDNICEYLLNTGKSEGVIQGWRATLDFGPVEEYVTAYNTWGTSQKSKLLETTYFHEDEAVTVNVQLEEDRVLASSFVFKLCRVHNIYDLLCAVENKVNMIGIHAVYLDRDNYRANEMQYRPLYSIPDENLPVASYEIDGIKDMQRYLPTNVKVALILERELKVGEIERICKLYGINANSIYCQLQHRVSLDYLRKIKAGLNCNVIVVIGLLQNDFVDYFWEIHSMLDCEKDYILLDCSKHQPDVLSLKTCYRSDDKDNRLFYLSQKISGNTIPVIIADDVEVDMMKKYVQILNFAGVRVGGIDIQNCVETGVHEQRYRLVNVSNKRYQIRIRKSNILLSKWRRNIDEIEHNRKER